MTDTAVRRSVAGGPIPMRSRIDLTTERRGRTGRGHVAPSAVRPTDPKRAMLTAPTGTTRPAARRTD